MIECESGHVCDCAPGTLRSGVSGHRTTVHTNSEPVKRTPAHLALTLWTWRQGIGLLRKRHRWLSSLDAPRFGEQENGAIVRPRSLTSLRWRYTVIKESPEGTSARRYRGRCQAPIETKGKQPIGLYSLGNCLPERGPTTIPGFSKP